MADQTATVSTNNTLSIFSIFFKLVFWKKCKIALTFQNGHLVFDKPRSNFQNRFLINPTSCDTCSDNQNQSESCCNIYLVRFESLLGVIPFVVNIVIKASYAYWCLCVILQARTRGDVGFAFFEIERHVTNDRDFHPWRSRGRWCVDVGFRLIA